MTDLPTRFRCAEGEPLAGNGRSMREPYEPFRAHQNRVPHGEGGSFFRGLSYAVLLSGVICAAIYGAYLLIERVM